MVTFPAEDVDGGSPFLLPISLRCSGFSFAISSFNSCRACGVLYCTGRDGEGNCCRGVGGCCRGTDLPELRLELHVMLTHANHKCSGSSLAALRLLGTCCWCLYDCLGALFPSLPDESKKSWRVLLLDLIWLA